MIGRWAPLLCLFVPALPAQGPSSPPEVIRTACLDVTRPYFVPTHPRVTTTIRFPHEIGAPEGSVAVFAEDADKALGAEYLVGWQQGDPYFTILPFKNARMANLNVPYQGGTYVLYFYPVEDPLNAAASITLLEPSPGSPSTITSGQPAPSAGAEGQSTGVHVSRQTEPPAGSTIDATPAGLLGFLDRLKLIHATPEGPRLTALTTAMNVQVALSREAAAVTEEHIATKVPAGNLLPGLNDYGWYQIVLLRAVRDPRLNCLGFICLLRNTSDRPLAFDVNSFGVRAGAEYLGQRLSDATPILQPHEQAPAYFIVESKRTAPLQAANAWHISVDLLSPRLNPGAAIARGFAPTP